MAYLKKVKTNPVREDYIGLTFMKPMFLLLLLLGMYPSFSFPKLHKTYSLLIFALILLSFFYMEVEELVSSHSNLKPSEITLSILMYWLLGTNNLFSIINSVFGCRNTWIALHQYLEKFDTNMHFRETFKQKRFMYALLVIFHSCFIVLMSMDGYATYTASLSFLRYLVIRPRIYFVQMLIVAVSLIASSLENRFNYLNSILQKISKSDIYEAPMISFKLYNNEPLFVAEKKKTLLTIMKNYNILRKAVEEANKIFGMQILLITGLLMAGCLDSINISLIYDTSGNTKDIALAAVFIVLVMVSINKSCWSFHPSVLQILS